MRHLLFQNIARNLCELEMIKIISHSKIQTIQKFLNGLQFFKWDFLKILRTEETWKCALSSALSLSIYQLRKIRFEIWHEICDLETIQIHSHSKIRTIQTFLNGFVFFWMGRDLSFPDKGNWELFSIAFFLSALILEWCKTFKK